MNHPEIAEIQELVMESVPVMEILGALSPEGHWIEHYNMYLPKYRANIYSLLILTRATKSTKTRFVDLANS